MKNELVINEQDRCYSVSADRKILIKYHWHSGESLTIPETIEIINPFAIANMYHITQVRIPQTILKIGRGAFCGCSSLNTVIFTSSHHPIVIDRQAFWKCHSLENINLPSNIEAIPEGCFEDCRSIQQIMLPSKLKRIDKYSFKGCGKIQNIFIGSDVEDISSDAFDEMESLSSIVVHSDNPKYKSFYGILFEGQAIFRVPEAFNCLREGDNEINVALKYAINNSTALMEGAFRNTQIQSIHIPKTINSIFYKVFEGCKQLKEIHFQEGIKISFIGWRTFGDCSNLKTIVIPHGVGIVGHNAFENCSSLRVVYIPPSVWRIKRDAFCGCNKLQAIVFIKRNESVRRLEKNTYILLPNEECKIIIPMREKEYFEEILKENVKSIYPHPIL